METVFGFFLALIIFYVLLEWRLNKTRRDSEQRYADLEAKTQKELLAAHRADPAGASCHLVMDPLGLALENYDGIGAFRTEDKGSAVLKPSGPSQGRERDRRSSPVDGP